MTDNTLSQSTVSNLAGTGNRLSFREKIRKIPEKVLEKFKWIWNKFGSLKEQMCSGTLFWVVFITLLVILGWEIGMATWNWLCYDTKHLCSSSLPQPITGADCNYLYFLSFTMVSYTTQSSIILMMVVFFYLTLSIWSCPKEGTSIIRDTDSEENTPAREQQILDLSFASLTKILIGVLSISPIPTGISLVVCALSGIRLIQYMGGVEVYIAIAGIWLISIAFLSTLREQESKPYEKKQIIIKNLEEFRELLIEDSEPSHSKDS